MEENQREQLKDDLGEVLESIKDKDDHHLEDAMHQLIDDFYGESECHHQLNNAIHELAHAKQFSTDDIEEIQDDLTFVMEESEKAASKTIGLVDELRSKMNGQLTEEVDKLLNDIVIAQEYQDLSGQRVKKVRQIFEFLEEPVKSVVSCSCEIRKREGIKDEEPEYQGDSVKNQQDVDDLMQDLGI